MSNNLILGNVVWKRYIVSRLADWLLWLRSIHLESHLHLWEKYVQSINPEIAANRALKNHKNKEQTKETSLIDALLIPPDDFWSEMETLTGTPEKVKKMYKVSLSVTIYDILFELDSYAQSFTEIEAVCDFISSYSAWFDELLNHFRGYQYNLLIQAGKL
jgi:predicted tellurium resistance membrane protein TerC